MKKYVLVFFAFSFLFIPYASGNDKEYVSDFQYSISQIMHEIAEVKALKENINSKTLTNEQKEQIKNYLFSNLNQAFTFLSDPANEKNLNYAKKNFLPLLPDDSKKIAEGFIEVSSLNLSTEDKIKLFVETQGSTGDVIYNVGLQVATFGLYLFGIGMLFVLTIIFQVVGAPFLFGGILIGAIGVWIMMIGAFCQLVFG